MVAFFLNGSGYERQESAGTYGFFLLSLIAAITFFLYSEYRPVAIAE